MYVFCKKSLTCRSYTLQIRFTETKSFLRNTKNADRNYINDQKTNKHTTHRDKDEIK